jgi:hypothetical protein
MPLPSRKQSPFAAAHHPKRRPRRAARLTALAQAREAGEFTMANKAFWAAAIKADGETAR